MAPYDSDSSAGEEDEFTETNVLLGYASKDPGDETISRLGGRPEWLDESSPPSAALARCNICKDLMVLLLQLDGELPERFPGHERRLYVFSCRRKSCRRREGSIRTLRSVRIAPSSTVSNVSAKATKDKKDEKPKPKEEAPKSQPPSNLGETLFGAKTMGSPSGSANPFSTTVSSSGNSNPFASPINPFSSSPAPPKETKPEPEPEPESEFASQSLTTKTTTADEIKDLPKTFAETLSLNNPQTQAPSTPPEPWPAAAQQPSPYPISYLSEADYETLDPTPAPIPQNTRMDIDSTDNSKGGKEDREVFESTMDTTFQKFADRLSQNPEQAIRYEFGGQPLLYSKTDTVGKLLHVATPGNGPGNGVTTTGGGIPRCTNCGAGRTFEVQMTPHAITELEAEELSLEGMDWGTIIVGVCERDCQMRGVAEGQVGYVEEWAGVQWEELTGRR
ncbi:programmed cell death protein 2 [Annulohypoxylon maeteangense]|uniref:programmed cell death protein 2 n=1 Tax=Annulohypoxylon maeteangense TaxID=1927788 RepID=UPI002008C190|nr:programmed cell death protein 2 [Annulohypoxylon maeteangense]KAI0886998.1 programmed cell death protein 2 [Annulohypoxylon maeteangense]